ncbi:hypothetical protein AAFF_G00315620 [Aldrovandia affinis]|uniref:Gypsy retrotransposon integrase-like protein 1 n=1 Tax=Aldrovandia affinis TaxID=143900 RepID=A0AAD7WQI7_9TELE|nr:hypothetical protein AAFF_G00315620 [Aldrovandia affinis]
MSFTGDWSVNWDIFRAEYEDYVLVTGTAEKDKKIQAATLRSVMGSECRHVYRHNLNLSVAGTGDPAVILDELEKYFKPAKNTIYERYVFGSCKQEEGESIDNFVTRLRERAATCEYGQLKDEMIRDKIVLGVANESIRRRLLREKGLTLITAIEMCRAAEQTDIRMRAMDMSTTSPPHTEAVHAVAKQHSRQNQWKQSNPPRTGDTGLVQFTIPGDVLKVEHAQPGALTKEQLINKYRDVFNSPVESVPGEVHFDLDPNVPAVQSAPRNVPIAMKAAVKAQLDKYEADGHIAPVTDPTDWISNMQEQEDVQHVNQADYLNVSSQRLEQIRRHTDRDECLQALKNTVLMGWPDVKEEAPLIAREYWPFRDEISVQNGVLFRGQKVIIPKSLRPEMLTRIHSSHIGGEACYRHAQETLYWPNMQTEIKDFVSTCSTCNVYAHNQQKETMLSHDLPTRPWQILSMDMFTHRQKDYLLIVDHYSDFWEIELLPDMSAETVIKRCKAQFARHGQPERVITDNGPQFTSQFTRFTSEWEFEHVTSSPRHPKANGKAESAVKIAKNLLRKAAHDGDDPWKAILHWRNTPTENMGSSPAQRLMSRRLKTSIPATNKLLEPVVVVGVTEKLRHRKQLAKSFYDRSARDLPELEVGETVRMKPLPGDNTGRWRVGTCLRRVAPRSYLVDVDGSLYRRNRVDLRVAEPTARATHKTDGPEAAHAPEAASAPETAVEAPPTVTEPSPVRSTPKAPSSPVGAPPSDGHTYTRVGRLSKPPLRFTM